MQRLVVSVCLLMQVTSLLLLRLCHCWCGSTSPSRCSRGVDNPNAGVSGGRRGNRTDFDDDKRTVGATSVAIASTLPPEGDVVYTISNSVESVLMTCQCPKRTIVVLDRAQRAIVFHCVLMGSVGVCVVELDVAEFVGGFSLVDRVGDWLVGAACCGRSRHGEENYVRGEKE